MGLISVKDELGIAKYKQIIQSIENGLLDGVIKKGDRLPSINSIRNKFSLSRDTVLLAYNELKVRGIVQSIAGKGYYVKSENIHITQKVFLLFDELNSFKEDLYNSFKKNLDPSIEVDIYFHHFNQDVFNKLIYDSIGNYSYYVIMPANLRDTHLVIDKLPISKVYILDQTHEELSKFPAIFQNFEKDIYNALVECKKSLSNYRKLIFIFQENIQPPGMLKGFNKFCEDHQINSEVIAIVEDRIISKGEVYLIPGDRNLILIIKKIKENNFILSKDIGIISYNETLLKEIVAGGMTTISTDFKTMGQRLAQMITEKERLQIENPSKLILRNSL